MNGYRLPFCVKLIQGKGYECCVVLVLEAELLGEILEPPEETDVPDLYCLGPMLFLTMIYVY